MEPILPDNASMIKNKKEKSHVQIQRPPIKVEVIGNNKEVVKEITNLIFDKLQNSEKIKLFLKQKYNK